MNLPSVEPITIDELYGERLRMLGPVDGSTPAGIGLWVISDYLIDDIAKKSLGLGGDLAHLPSRPDESLRLFGAPILQLQTPARIAKFLVVCSFCGAWLKPSDDCLCQACGKSPVI